MHIVGVRKDSSGTILQYKLRGGAIIDHEQAIEMVSDGRLEGYNISTAKDGTKSIRSNPDGDTTNNLDNLPNF